MEQGEHISEEILACELGVREMWALFVLLGEALFRRGSIFL